MKTLDLNIIQRGYDERDMWQSTFRTEPNEEIITGQLEQDLNDDPFNGRGVESVDISINFPKSDWTLEEVEATFSYENEGYLQDEDDEFFYADYSKSK